MINKKVLVDKLTCNYAEGLYNKVVEEPIVYNGYTLKNRPYTSYLELHYPNGTFIMDNPDFITIYSEELLDVEYDSILIAGLGLGTQAYVSQDFAQVDVIESDQNIIDINNQLGYLNENVNIIKDDIFTFSTEKIYDIIVLDIWWKAPEKEVSDQLIEKFLPHINVGGFIYIPLNKGELDEKVIIIKKQD
jgi:protein-L-isoaspartate O-methyltransferase